jgi:PAS domain-containing protein
MKRTVVEMLKSKAARTAERLNAAVRTNAHREATGIFGALAETLADLRLATDYLQAASDDLVVAREERALQAAHYRELHQALPVPCVLTDEDGHIEEVNAAASALLDVAPRYVEGKDFLLFFPERDVYFQLLDGLRSAGAATARTIVRPREKRSRPVTISASTLKNQQRVCWILMKDEPGG